MDIESLNDLKYGVYEAYSELFSNEVYYSELIVPSYVNIYNEERNKMYNTPSKLTALVNLSPKAEDISMVGQENGVNSTFDIPLYCLEQIGVASKLIKDLKKAIITFQGIKYDIVNVTPKNNVGEIFLSYLFECRGEENGV